MRLATDRFFCVFALAAMCGLMVCPLTARAGFDFDGTPYSQNFDGLTSTTWANDTTLPGWYLINSDGNNITGILLGNASTSGSFYGFGAAGERALGGVGADNTYFGGPASGAVAGWIALALINDTKSTTYTSIDLEYDGEQWRNGGASSPNVSVAQTMVMEYGFGESFASVSWGPTGFDFTSPTFGTTASANLDGNDSANRIADIGGTISSLDWNPGEILWLRWIERNDVGNDHGLAIDNFRFSATAAVVPELSNLYTCSGLVGALGLYGLAATLVKRRRLAHVAST